MISPRSQARRYATILLYQWYLTGEDPLLIKKQLLDDLDWLAAIAAELNHPDNQDQAEFTDTQRRFNFNMQLLDELLTGIPVRLKELDTQLSLFVDRPLEQIDPVELVILRLGAFEILFADNIPNRVAINEAVELAKLFGATEGYKYVNGVLDKIARQHSLL